MRTARAAAGLIASVVMVTACAGSTASPASPTPTVTFPPTPTAVATATASPTAAPTPAPIPTDFANGPAPDFLACMVAGPGGIADNGLNAASYAGLQDAHAARQIQTDLIETEDGPAFVAAVKTFGGQSCGLIVTVGFRLDDATAGAAVEFPDQRFGIVDFAFDTGDADYVARLASEMGVTADEAKTALDDNVRGMTFQMDQASMLAGYLAAGVSVSGKIGTFGVVDIPEVTIAMDGLAAGVNYYNLRNSASVELIGWDAVAREGTFLDGSEDEDPGGAAARDLMESGADIIVPVVGAAFDGAAEAAQAAADPGIMLIGVEFDQSISKPEYADVILTSILKRVDTAVHLAIDQAIDGTFTGGPSVGTLANDQVGLAPYHELAGAVPATLTTEIDALRAAIVDGSVTVADYLAPAR